MSSPARRQARGARGRGCRRARARAAAGGGGAAGGPPATSRRPPRPAARGVAGRLRNPRCRSSLPAARARPSPETPLPRFPSGDRAATRWGGRARAARRQGWSGPAARAVRSSHRLLREVAGGELVGTDDAQRGRLGAAAVVLAGVGAARVERAARRRVGGRRYVTLQHDALPRDPWVGHGYGGEERRGVGMPGGAIQW